MDLVWNTESAERVRSESERIMQDQSSNLRQSAKSFLEAASRNDARIAQISARLPIMMTVEVSIEVRDEDGNYMHTRTESRSVQDTAAMAAAQAEIAQLRAANEELRSAARKFDSEAYEHDRAIRRTNELFAEMFELAQAVDTRYAARLSEIKMAIDNYLDRILELRDSMGIETPGGSTRGALLMNQTTFTTPWVTIGEILAKPYERITVNEFEVLAFHFVNLNTPAAQERFLNMMARPVPIPPHSHAFSNEFGFVPFEVCARTISEIRTHVDLKISANLAVTMMIPTSDPNFDRLERENRRLMQQSTLLAVAGEIARDSQWQNPEPSWRRVLHCQGNGPFRVEELVPGSGIITMTVNHGILEGTPPFDTGEIRFLGDSALRGNNPVHIRPAHTCAGVNSAARSLAAHNFRVINNFDLSSHLLSGPGEIALTLITPESLGLAVTTARIFVEIPVEVLNAREIQRSFEQFLNYATVGQYHQNFRLNGVIVEEEGVRGRDPILWDIFSWPTAYTFLAIDALNDVSASYVNRHNQASIPQFTPQQFFENPLVALEVFINMHDPRDAYSLIGESGINLCICGTCATRGRNDMPDRVCRDAREAFMGDFNRQMDRNIANRQPLSIFLTEEQTSDTQPTIQEPSDPTHPRIE